MKKLLAHSFILLSFILAACGGSSHEISLQFTGTNAFGDSLVADLVILAQSVPEEGKGSETFVFPSNCRSSVSISGNTVTVGPNCGISVRQSGTYSIGSLAQGRTYTLQARFRNASGVILYSGTTQFLNTSQTAPVEIVISPVAGG